MNSYEQVGNESVVLSLSMQLFVEEIQDFLEIYMLHFITIRHDEKWKVYGLFVCTNE